MSYYDLALEHATEVLGSRDKAIEWLAKMSVSLGSAPQALLTDKEGFDRVRRHLHSVEIALDTD